MKPSQINYILNVILNCIVYAACLLYGISVWMILASLLFRGCSASAQDIYVPYRWTVNTARPAKQDIAIVRGETIAIEPTYQSYDGPVDLTACYEVRLRYRSADMAEGTYYAATGSVINATNGQVRILWSTEQEAAADVYAYDIKLSGSDSASLKASGSIRLTGGVTGTETNVPNVVTGRFDWASVEHENIDAAPFVDDGDLLAVTQRLDGHDTAISNVTDLVGTGVDGVESNLQAHVAEAAATNSAQDELIALALQTANTTFAGSGSTGVVSSAAGDAGKFLQADGTWATPATDVGSVAWDAITGAPSNLVETIESGAGIEISGGNTETATVAVAASVIAGAAAGATAVQPEALAGYAPTGTVGIVASDLTSHTALSGAADAHGMSNTVALAAGALPTTGGTMTGAIYLNEGIGDALILYSGAGSSDPYYRFGVSSGGGIQYDAGILGASGRTRVTYSTNGVMTVVNLGGVVLPNMTASSAIITGALSAASIVLGGVTNTAWPTGGGSPSAIYADWYSQDYKDAYAPNLAQLDDGAGGLVYAARQDYSNVTSRLNVMLPASVTDDVWTIKHHGGWQTASNITFNIRYAFTKGQALPSSYPYTNSVTATWAASNMFDNVITHTLTNTVAGTNSVRLWITKGDSAIGSGYWYWGDTTIEVTR